MASGQYGVTFFIEADYWKNNYEMVREMIPKAEVFVSEENGQIRGFIGLIDTYIAGIFCKSSGTIERCRDGTASYRYEVTR